MPGLFFLCSVLPYFYFIDKDDFKGILIKKYNTNKASFQMLNQLRYSYAVMDTLSVIGAGSDIWGRVENFHYAYKPLDGDGTMFARVYRMQGTINVWSKAGVMNRESLNTDDFFVFVANTSANGSSVQYRKASGSSITGLVTAPTWVILVRSGDNFTAYFSDDGEKM